MEDIVDRYIFRQIAKNKIVDPKRFKFDGDYLRIEYEEERKKIPKELSENLLIFEKKTIPNKDFIVEMIKRYREDVDLFILDHLHYVELETSDENRETGEIMKALKTVNEEIKKPIVVVSHMRKRIGKRMKNEKPTESDLH